MPENPFFTRELRALGRRQFGPIAWPLVVLNLLLFIPLLLLERIAQGHLRPAEAWQGLALVFLGLFHASVCGAVGWIMGSRVFGVEHRQRALEGLRLISEHPARWLAQKLVFPLYALGLVWFSSTPVYAAMVVRGHFLPRQLEPGMLLAACVGLLAFGMALLTPPEGLRSPLRQGQRMNRPAARRDLLLLALPAWISLVLLRMSEHWMRFALGDKSTPYAREMFFDTHLSTLAGLLWLMAAYLAAALGAAYATAHPAGRWAETARFGGRCLATGMACFLFIGYTRSFGVGSGPAYLLISLAAMTAAVLVAAPPALFKKQAAPSPRRPETEDPLARHEIDRLSRIFENPVLVRDLRATLRGAGLTRQFLLYSAGILAGSALLGAMAAPLVGVTRAGNPNLSPWLRNTGAGALLLGSWFILPALLAYGGRSLAMWGTERRCTTLVQIFTTPLTTEALVRGRWGAALIVGVARALPIPLSFLGGLMLVANGRDLEVFLAQGLWLASMGLVLSAGLAGSAQNSVEVKDLFCAGCLAVYTVMLEGVMFMWKWTQVEYIGTYLDRSPLALFSLQMVPVNLVIAWLVFRRSVHDIESLREREAEAL